MANLLPEDADPVTVASPFGVPVAAAAASLAPPVPSAAPRTATAAAGPATAPPVPAYGLTYRGPRDSGGTSSSHAPPSIAAKADESTAASTVQPKPAQSAAAGAGARTAGSRAQRYLRLLVRHVIVWSALGALWLCMLGLNHLLRAPGPEVVQVLYTCPVAAAPHVPTPLTYPSNAPADVCVCDTQAELSASVLA